jgi:hypothetical protein
MSESESEAAVALTAIRARRERLLRAVGPHLQVGETRTVDVPAQPGVGAHRDFLATTACEREVSTTLVTRIPARVRCPDCNTALAALPAPGSEDRA